jgi:predicted Zn-dependent peptidase
MPDRSISPPQAKNDALHIHDPEPATLDNGLPVFLINAGDEEVTRLDVIIKAGTAYQDHKLVAGTVGKLLKEGTSSYESADIASAFDYYGAYFDTNVSKDTAILSLYSLTKHLPELLPMISEMLAQATFPEHEFHLHIDRKQQEYLINREKVRYVAMLEFNKLVFGEESAYGQTISIDDFKAIQHDQLMDFYRKNYALDRSYAIISGRANHDVVQLINRYLGNGWSTPGPSDKQILFTAPFQPGEQVIKKEDAMQSAIRVGRPIINKQHPEYNRFVLLNTILGGYFGSRLMSNLREEKGFTYGVSSYIINYIHGSSFSIGTEVNVDHTQAAIDEIFFEMNKLREEKVGDDELQLVKNYIYGTFLRNFDGPFALADRFRSVKDFGLGFDYYLKSLDEIMNTTSDELLETAQNYFDPGQMIRLVVGRLD